MKTIRKIEPLALALPAKKKVAAYARVSMETERLHHSLAAQVSYYSDLIQKNPKWKYVGVYADDGISGTSTAKREGFQRMLKDCEKGKIDLILTKSISRFARNTVDLLEAVRHLKDLGIEVRFEEQNISTMSGDGELMMTILASFAQEEIRSTSQNIRWAKKKQFEQGNMTNTSVPYGYTCKGKAPVIIPEQAEIVKRIFNEFNDGALLLSIIDELNKDGITGQRNGAWTPKTITRMLQNPFYAGHLLLGKYYVEDPMKHKLKKNCGERDMYFVENDHEAIINQETFDKAQEELKRRSELGPFVSPKITQTEFSRKIICECCGKPFRRIQINMAKGTAYSWSCAKPGGKCMTPSILTSELEEIITQVLEIPEYNAEAFTKQVDHLSVSDKDVITFHLKNGEKKKWQFQRRRRSPLISRRKATTALAGKIFCRKCGNVYHYSSQRSEQADGHLLAYWRIPAHKECGCLLSMRDDDLKNLLAEIMHTDGFDEAAAAETIKKILVGEKDITVLFFDGHEETAAWKNISHKGTKWSEERKQQAKKSGTYKWSKERRKAMSKKMKLIRSQNHGKNS
jgi:site-specific DNA recombinase